MVFDTVGGVDDNYLLAGVVALVGWELLVSRTVGANSFDQFDCWPNEFGPTTAIYTT
jgi:hypothetical protein